MKTQVRTDPYLERTRVFACLSKRAQLQFKDRKQVLTCKVKTLDRRHHVASTASPLWQLGEWFM